MYRQHHRPPLFLYVAAVICLLYAALLVLIQRGII